MSKHINVTKSSLPPMREYVDEIRDLWDSHWLTNMGAKHKEFQALLEQYLEVPDVELLVNGHMALEMAIQAFALEGEVITTPFTFASTTHAIVRNGLTPVFCDINPEDCTIDTGKIEALITEKTRAIVPVHVYGNICDTDGIWRLADKYNLKVIYDAAHAFGETCKGKAIGNFGDAACFSFHATKVFNTIEGGAVCFSDKEIGAKIYDLKNFGIHGTDIVSGIGANAKMNEFCAAMGICNLRHIDTEIAKRRKAAERYNEQLAGVAGIRIMQADCLRSQQDVTSNYAYYPVLFDGFRKSRDQVLADLAAEGIIARKYFYPLTSDFECYKDYPFAGAGKTPVAKYIADRVLTLPLYAGLVDEDVDRVCRVVLDGK